MEKAITIGIGTYKEELKESMLELENLALANDIIIEKTFTQALDKMSTFAYVGKGKLEELKEYLDNDESIKYLIANDELSASQIRNMQDKLDNDQVEILDRTTLILAIFKDRAKTREAQVQVEIASLQYDLAHLVLKEANYDQQRGVSGLANRGSGEKEIDLDRRVLKNKIHDLKSELKSIESSRFQQKKQRNKSEKPLVSLVGYTNAGKSTIMNNFISDDENKKVFEKDMLFATLDTSVRKVQLNNNREILLSDTVGFIDKLPHQLVTSFKSTLEEAVDADLIIHVVDYSNENYKKHIAITNETLKEIGVSDLTKMVYVYNKVDKVTNFDLELDDNSTAISAKKSDDIQKLKLFIYDHLFSDVEVYKLLIPYNMYSEVDYLIKETNIIDMDNVEEGVILNVELSKKEYERYKKYIKE